MEVFDASLEDQFQEAFSTLLSVTKYVTKYVTNTTLQGRKLFFTIPFV